MKADTFPERVNGVLDVSANDTDQEIMLEFYQSLVKGEPGQASLELTEKMITLNSASYTAWFWRRKCLLANDKSADILAELTFADLWCTRNPKNYQVWYHRRWVFDQICLIHPHQIGELLPAELQRIEELIIAEPKHYNAWTHRLYLAKRFGLFRSLSELDFADRMIVADVRNNSAWNYRRTAIIFHPAIIPNELEYIIHKIRIAPNNESPWIYLRSFPGWSTDNSVECLVRELGIYRSQDGSSLSVNRDAVETLSILELSSGNLKRCCEILLELSSCDHVRERSLISRRNRVLD